MATIRLEGSEELARKLNRLSDAMRGAALLDAVQDGAEIVRDVAGQLAPVVTGRLAGHIGTRVDEATAGRAVVDIGPEKYAWYGFYVEKGTQFAAAQPFLRPAFDETKASMVDAIAENLRRRVMVAIR